MSHASSPVPDLSYPSEAQRWPPAFPPACAVAWGDDQYGLWIDVVIGGPVQRFRWIEPGEFVMGSPEGEEGRYGNEGPQHVVRLTEGFWLAETTCSQAVWVAVMGNKPSWRWDEPRDPVTQVSWDDVDGFLRQLEGLLPGLKAELPSEAEWEYACRAGNTDAFTWGNRIAPEMAFYDSSIAYLGSPSRKSFNFKAGLVKYFLPNGWGLYQMHGNVWEWCADGPRYYAVTAQVNPRGATSDEVKSLRVVRGGGWHDDASGLRSSCRLYWGRAGRSDDRGFRLLLRSTSPGAKRPPEALLTRDA